MARYIKNKKKITNHQEVIVIDIVICQMDVIQIAMRKEKIKEELDNMEMRVTNTEEEMTEDTTMKMDKDIVMINYNNRSKTRDQIR